MTLSVFTVYMQAHLLGSLLAEFKTTNISMPHLSLLCNRLGLLYWKASRHCRPNNTISLYLISIQLPSLHLHSNNTRHYPHSAIRSAYSRFDRIYTSGHSGKPICSLQINRYLKANATLTRHMTRYRCIHTGLLFSA